MRSCSLRGPPRSTSGENNRTTVASIGDWRKKVSPPPVFLSSVSSSNADHRSTPQVSEALRQLVTYLRPLPGFSELLSSLQLSNSTLLSVPDLMVLIRTKVLTTSSTRLRSPANDDEARSSSSSDDSAEERALERKTTLAAQSLYVGLRSEKVEADLLAVCLRRELESAEDREFQARTCLLELLKLLTTARPRGKGEDSRSSSAVLGDTSSSGDGGVEGEARSVPEGSSLCPPAEVPGGAAAFTTTTLADAGLKTLFRGYHFERASSLGNETLVQPRAFQHVVSQLFVSERKESRPSPVLIYYGEEEPGRAGTSSSKSSPARDSSPSRGEIRAPPTRGGESPPSSQGQRGRTRTTPDPAYVAAML